MPTQIATSSTADATATPSATLVAVAPSDSTVNAVFFDDANGGPHLATAASPYSSFSSQAVGSATHRNAQGVYQDSNDNLQLVVTSPASGPAYFTAARSGGTWSPSFVGFADGGGYEASTTGNGVALGLVTDQQGRLWAFGVDDVNATYQVWCDYLSGSWASGGAAVEGLNLGEQNRRGLAGCLAGNYLVLVYDSGSGGLKYLRADVHGASIGSWSTAAAVGSVSDVTTASVLAFCPVPGGSKAMLVYSGSNGISALVYDASADSWGAATVLSSSANDRHPTLIPGASGTVYAVWCQYAAANSYALVGEAYSSGAWVGSTTTLEASGNNIAWPNGALLGSKLALIWTQGTSNPYSVEFDNPAAPPTSSSHNLGAVARAHFDVRAPLALSGRSHFLTRAVMLAGARVHALLRAKLVVPARDTFKVKFLVGIAPAPMRSTFAQAAQLVASFTRQPMAATPNTTVKSTVTVKDALGNAVSTCSAVTVTVTFPDGSQQTGFALGAGVTNNGDGTYTIEYKTKAEGLVVEDWSVVDASGTVYGEFHNTYGVSY